MEKRPQTAEEESFQLTAQLARVHRLMNQSVLSLESWIREFPNGQEDDQQLIDELNREIKRLDAQLASALNRFDSDQAE